MGISSTALCAIVACSANDSGDTPRRNSSGGSGGSTSSNGGTGNPGTGGANKGGSTSAGGSSNGTSGSGGSGGTSSASGGTSGSTNGGSGNPSAGSGGAAPQDNCTPGGTGFEVVGDIAIDKKTCLAWHRRDPERDVSACASQARFHPSALCWDLAKKNCDDLSLAGRDDWRLPTAAELKTLVVNGESPAIDKSVFDQAQALYYWTSEKTDGTHAKCIDFSNGQEKVAGTDGPQAFRCVRDAK